MLLPVLVTRTDVSTKVLLKIAGLKIAGLKIAGLKIAGLKIAGLKIAGVELDRKVLAELAISDPSGFTRIAKLASEQL